MLADHHTRVELVVEPGTRAYTAIRCLNRHPVAIGDPACLRCNGMKFHFRMRGALAQTGQGAVLGLQNSVGFAFVRISGKRAAKSGRATGRTCGSSKSGSGA